MAFKLKSSNLSFRVKTAETMPTTGTENDIAIITAVPMKNWIMSPDAPGGAPRTDGDVWLQYSVSGDVFNALRSNAMMIAPRKAWQYVNGAWTNVPSSIYKNGDWNPLNVDGYLYNRGDECDSVTGGWTFTQGRSSNPLGTYVKNADSIELTVTETQSSTQAVTANTVNLTDYSKIHINVLSSNVGYLYLKCGTTQIMANGEEKTDTLTAGTHSLDISSLSGSYYIAVEAFSNKEAAKAGSATFDRIWLEK